MKSLSYYKFSIASPSPVNKLNSLFFQNCKLANYPYGPHDTSIYLIHRGGLYVFQNLLPHN